MKIMFFLIFLMSAAALSAAVPFTRTSDFTPVTIGERARNAKETMFFAEAQLKYGMFQNYLHYWIDRPLFWNRATRHPERRFAYMTYPSFMIDVEQLRKYEMDGLGAFGMHAGKFRQLKQADGFLEKGKVSDVMILPQITYGEAVVRSDTKPDEIVDMLKYCLESPRMPRINGKLLVGTYNYRLLSAVRHKELMKQIAEMLGRDDFLIIGDMDFGRLRKLQAAFRKNGMLNRKQTAELEKLITDVLDVAGGIQLITTELIRPSGGDYTSRYDTSFFDNCTSKALEKIMARPEYKDKILGFFVNQGYINHLSGMNHGEYGTSTLRNIMRRVLKHNPDYVLFFEWNEANENTCFQPTVYSGQTVGRLIKYYSHLSKGKPFAPYAGEDASIPNLTLSHRATLKPGEVLRFELLNIPDGAPEHTITAQLKLTDQSGKVLLAFPEEKITSTLLGSIDYSVPGEAFAAGSVIRPVLTANGKTYTDFQTIRIDPTMSWNYKAVRQNLRDMLNVGEFKFNVRKLDRNRYRFAVDLKASEPLASVELMNLEDEIAAAGAEKEYDAENNLIVRLALTAPPHASSREPGKIRVLNASSPGISANYLANVDPGAWKNLPDGSGIHNNFHLWTQETVYFIQISKKDAGKAVIELDFKNPDIGIKRIPVDIVEKNGVYAVVLNPKTALRAEALKMTNLPDLPQSSGQKHLNWSGTVETDTPYPVFTVRAIGRSGRIYRSHAVMPVQIPSAPFQEVACFSETVKKAVKVKIPEALLPDIHYLFGPDSGAMLRSDSGRYFDGRLGGGFHYMEAFSHPLTKVAAGDRAPQWVRDGKEWLLRFDGVNDYINFTRETFPQGAFTLQMEIRPDCADRTMVLFRHFNYFLGSLSLFIRDGRLYACWGEKNLRNFKFATSLPVRNGAWNRIEVKYDFSRLAFTVNGKSEIIPFRGRAYAFKSAIFGGHDKREYAPDEPLVFFKGDLRKLAIRHY